LRWRAPLPNKLYPTQVEIVPLNFYIPWKERQIYVSNFVFHYQPISIDNEMAWGWRPARNARRARAVGKKMETEACLFHEILPSERGLVATLIA
jgi:hypothetical protein